MFRPAGLFRSVQCPALTNCDRHPCPFSHAETSRRSDPALLPIPQVATPASSSNTSTVKRPVPSPTASDFEPEPPRKVQVVANRSTKGNTLPRATPAAKTSKPVATSSASTNGSKPRPQKPTPVAAGGGPPSLNATPATSKIPIRDRQQMLSNLYEHFRKLYEAILPQNPALAGEHALAQEIEVYNRSGANKMIYRNGIINSVGALKRRTPPHTIPHPSIGTEAEVQARLAALKEYPNLRLTPKHLTRALLTINQMKVWGYIVEVPEGWGAGGDKVNELGNQKKCERCGDQFTVHGTAEDAGVCEYHWARPYHTKVGGLREKIYRCCTNSYPSPGCQKGVHVFYESDPQALHSRHPFTPSSIYAVEPDERSPKPLDIAAIDCEMVYTTAGMSVARVSVVDGAGESVFDELVQMDDGVDVLDYNTRFSGVTSLEKATMNLEEIRRRLARLIGPDTIIVGHALENDLRTLRMVHHKAVDTVELFPHKAGPPARRALREIVLETLGQTIQAGASSSGEASASSVGHSSLEDARATLNLVRWWVVEREKRS